jgi:hypothetical protein
MLGDLVEQKDRLKNYSKYCALLSRMSERSELKYQFNFLFERFCTFLFLRLYAFLYVCTSTQFLCNASRPNGWTNLMIFLFYFPPSHCALNSIFSVYQMVLVLVTAFFYNLYKTLELSKSLSLSVSDGQSLNIEQMPNL